MPFFVPGDLDFKLVRASDQTRLPREFGTSPLSSYGDISYTNKNHRLMAPKNRTFRSSLHAVKTRVRERLLRPTDH